MSRLCSNILAEVHVVIEALVRELARGRAASGTSRLLDVGCWDGAATVRYAERLGAYPLGIEVFEGPAAEARARGIEVAQLDLEAASFPWPDASMDLVIANQVLEHLKNIWLPMGEMYRVLKPGAALIVSVPNLGSLHNRVMLGLGLQPTSIRTFGPHVRGFTRREFERFVSYRGALRIERSLGVGFPPLDPPWTRPLSWLWPGAAHTLVIVARKPRHGAPPWSEYVDTELGTRAQTFYRPELSPGA
jgi:SAM-dependent methyltransferase